MSVSRRRAWPPVGLSRLAVALRALTRLRWVVLGAAVGGLGAWVQVRVGTDGVLAGGRQATIGAAEFEKELTAAAPDGRPILKDVRVYPDGPAYVVRMERLTGDGTGAARPGGHPDGPAQGLAAYRPYSLFTKVPFVPAAAPSQTVRVVFRVSTGAVYVNDSRRAVYSGRFTAPAPPGARSPGSSGASAGAAELRLLLARADYDLEVSTAAAVPSITGTANGRPLPPFERVDELHWRARLPADHFIDGASQSLTFTPAAPVRFEQFRFVNPAYTVLDYLTWVHARHPEVSYHYGWWAGRRAAMVLWPAAGMFLIGLVWPALRLLRPGTGTPSPRPQAAPLPAPPVIPDAPTPALVPNEVEVESGDEGVGSEEVKTKDAAEGPKAPVRLRADPLIPAVPESPAEEKVYAGEYYPVARKATKKDAGHAPPG